MVWFVYNYFSISLLLRTFFSPWKRLGEERRGFFDPVFILIDILMRIFGASVRAITICIGLFFILVTILLGPVFLCLWLFLPFITVYLFVKGFILIFPDLNFLNK